MTDASMARAELHRLLAAEAAEPCPHGTARGDCDECAKPPETETQEASA